MLVPPTTTRIPGRITRTGTEATRIAADDDDLTVCSQSRMTLSPCAVSDFPLFPIHIYLVSRNTKQFSFTSDPLALHTDLISHLFLDRRDSPDFYSLNRYWTSSSHRSLNYLLLFYHIMDEFKDMAYKQHLARLATAFATKPKSPSTTITILLNVVDSPETLDSNLLSPPAIAFEGKALFSDSDSISEVDHKEKSPGINRIEKLEIC